MNNLGEYRRSHLCTELNANHEGRDVVLMGWVNRVRKLGQLIFITLRDYSGLIQLNIDEGTQKEAFDIASNLKSEYVITALGRVNKRAEKDVNPSMATGEIEIVVDKIVLLSTSDVLPFAIGDAAVSPALRLKHRYLDLRSDNLQYNLRLRSHVGHIIRSFLHNEGFAEIETPLLTNSSPEGARDFLVPSRQSPGSFYALPQSPQILKQILMISNFDRYFQVAKCLRDEDLRADRQPEFTQVDIEMSFIDIDDVLSLSERLLAKVFKEAIDVNIDLPIPRMDYNEAMRRFGSDKPDTRFGMELCDISELVKGSGFVVFDSALSAGGSVRCIVAKGQAGYSRKQVDSLVEFVKTYRAKGLAWVQYQSAGFKSSIGKFFDDDKLAEICAYAQAEEGDMLLICADSDDIVFDALGNLRLELARRLGMLDGEVFKPLWVLNFPLLEWSEEDARFYARHHPFTAPLDEDIDALSSNPKAARAKAYDLVINGYETAGGSIRIHRQDMQAKMFEVLGYSMEEAQADFRHLMEALKYGAPPHGGIAWGFDRLMMLLCNTTNIRDVVAFPKQQDGSCPMTQAPSPVTQAQLDELKLKV